MLFLTLEMKRGVKMQNIRDLLPTFLDKESNGLWFF